jgi:hypothetical protein
MGSRRVAGWQATVLVEVTQSGLDHLALGVAQLIEEGEVSVERAATELGIPADAVYNWLRLGQVPARRGPSRRWCIPWNPATQEIYRQKVANSFRLKPIPPATAPTTSV